MVFQPLDLKDINDSYDIMQVFLQVQIMQCKDHATHKGNFVIRFYIIYLFIGGK